MKDDKINENVQETQKSEQIFNSEEFIQKIEKLKLMQNLPLANLASLGSAMVMAVLWAVITVLTHRQIGYMAIGVGFAVGFSVQFAGKGIDKIYGVIGAAGALLGCILGNFLSQVAFLASDPEIGLSFYETLKLFLSNMPLTMEVMKVTFSLMDLVFYGIAIYVGYYYSFRKIDEKNTLDQ